MLLAARVEPLAATPSLPQMKMMMMVATAVMMVVVVMDTKLLFLLLLFSQIFLLVLPQTFLLILPQICDNTMMMMAMLSFHHHHQICSNLAILCLCSSMNTLHLMSVSVVTTALFQYPVSL